MRPKPIQYVEGYVLTQACIGKKRKLHGNAAQAIISCSTKPDAVEEASTCSTHMAERLSKLEQLFERFVCRKSPTSGGPILSPQSPPLTVSGSSDRHHKRPRTGSSDDLTSLSSIGDGIVS